MKKTKQELWLSIKNNKLVLVESRGRKFAVYYWNEKCFFGDDSATGAIIERKFLESKMVYIGDL